MSAATTWTSATTPARSTASRSWSPSYQTTRHVEEALVRLTEAYMAIGIVGEAQTAAAVLGHNFPDSRWYKDAYNLVKSGGVRAEREQGLLDQQGLQEGGAGARSDRLKGGLPFRIANRIVTAEYAAVADAHCSPRAELTRTDSGTFLACWRVCRSVTSS